jgi:1,4-dihydroxy-2-naphthoate octaprenyltransferase
LIIHSIFLVYLLGALFAILVGAIFDIIKFLFVYVILFTGTLSAMYNNNYNDVNIDKYSVHTFFSGGSSILVEHPELMTLVKRLSLLFIGISIVVGFIGMIIFLYPLTFFLFILSGNILGWYYTAPPVQLMYHGFGEMCTMLAVGLIVPGLGYFALAGQINVSYIPLLIPLLFHGFSLSFYLEIPDREADRQGHKNTLVVRHGVSFGFKVGVVSSFFATIIFLGYGFFHVVSGNINYWLVGLFSLIPLFFCVSSLLHYHDNMKIINTLVVRPAASFFIFYIILVGYFLYLL